MVHTYVAGPNIAKGAECDENVSTLRRSLITSPAKKLNAGAGQQQQQKEAVDRCRAYVASTGAKFGQPWVSNRLQFVHRGHIRCFSEHASCRSQQLAWLGAGRTGDAGYRWCTRSSDDERMA